MRGSNATLQSDAIAFTTPAAVNVSVPGAPRNLVATPVNNNVNLSWIAPANTGGTPVSHYEVSHNNGAWVIAQGMVGHSFTGLAVGGHTFRVRAVNTAGAGAHVSAAATVVAPPTPPPPSAGITVTVVDGSGRPIQGATVQFLRRTHPAAGANRFHLTNANGVAFFPNAAAGRYGINVTHPDFASTSHTSTPYTFVTEDNVRRRVPDFYRHRADQIQTVSFTMSERSSTFRNLNWGPMLYSSGSPTNRTLRISSVYGWREWANNPINIHNGVDIVAMTGDNWGRPLLAPFDGLVVSIFEGRWGSSSGGGLGLTMQYRCSRSRDHFYVRYFHMQNYPVRANDTRLRVNDRVSRGEHVGRMGDTPWWTGSDGLTHRTPVHLHVDVHRNYHATSTSVWRHTIDPNAFFAPGQFQPWNINAGLTVHP